MSNELNPFVFNQRSRTLAIIIWTVLIASFILGSLNLQYKTWNSIISLYGLTLICVPLLWLNSRGHFTLSALILSVIALIVININLYDGDGIRDMGILAFPIFIMAGTLFFGKRVAIYYTLTAIASLAGILYLEILGYIHPSLGTIGFNFLGPVVILLLVTGACIWAIVGNMEKYLQRVRESEIELTKNYDLTLAAWAKVLEYRDKETEGHSRRLVDLSRRLAQTLGISGQEIINLRRGALLHDLGKLAIPDEILLKPGPLDEDERKIVQQHPFFAKQMLTDVTFLQPSLDVAYCHHEHWDGHGYPQGLKGEQIPITARIFTIIDQWDALLSDRPYRKAWSRDEAVSYLRENSGKIFDPHIVEVFLSLIREDETNTHQSYE